MLATAIRRLDEQGKMGEKVYALEKPNRSRAFRIMTTEAAWARTSDSPKSSHFYEVLTGPCNLYLDIEWYTADKPAADAEAKVVNGIETHVRQALSSTYNETQVSVARASASGRSRDGRYKCSWHVHMACASVCWVNALAVGQFVRTACAGIHEVDKVPYAGQGQNWRCVGSSKATDPLRRFEPVDYTTFSTCTVQQPVAGRKLVYPTETISKGIDLPVPAHIQQLVSTLAAGGTPVMCGHDRCVVPFAELQVCEHVNRKHRSNHQYAVVNTGTLMWKMNCHSCADKISSWRAFPCMDAVEKAFAAQCVSYSASSAEPAIRTAVQGDVDIYDLQSHGPPPRQPGVSVMCIDGVYMA